MSQNKLETRNEEIQTLDADQIDAVSGGAIALLGVAAGALFGAAILVVAYKMFVR